MFHLLFQLFKEMLQDLDPTCWKLLLKALCLLAAHLDKIVLACLKQKVGSVLIFQWKLCKMNKVYGTIMSFHLSFSSNNVWTRLMCSLQMRWMLATVNFIFNIFASFPKLIYPLMLISWGHCPHKFVDFTILLPKPCHQFDVFSSFNFDKIHVALIEAFFKIMSFFSYASNWNCYCVSTSEWELFCCKRMRSLQFFS